MLCVSLLIAGCGDDTGTGGSGLTGDGGSSGGPSNNGGGAEGGNSGDGGLAGGMGTGGAGMICTPGSQAPCYTGAPATENLGPCHAGTQTCLDDGSGYGNCQGEVLPAAESCSSTEDEDCDGQTNEEGADCLCVPDTIESCYSGTSGTEGVGLCVAGTHVCEPDGLSYGICVGEVTPVAETCSVVGDEDCDGLSNEEGTDCVCTPGSTQACYSYTPTTEGVGVCHGGIQTCASNGQGFGACIGEVGPTPESCSTPLDDDCDGATNEEGTDCVCAPNTTRTCYSGPANTEGVGPCLGGTQTCTTDGLGYGPCEGEQLPLPETCNTLEDDDCDGSVNEEGVGCVCVPNTINACYSGPSGTEGVGLCVPGEAMCNEDGTVLGSCSGEVLPAFDNCTTPADEDCDAGPTGCTGDHVWSKRFGNSSAQFGSDVALDTAGNVVASGSFSGTVNFGGTTLTAAGSGNNMYLAKFEPNGNHLWSKRFGDGTATQQITSITTDSTSNVIITGYFGGSANFGGGSLSTPFSATTVFVAKFGPTGNHIWSKQFTNSRDQYSLGIATDAAGNIFLIGSFKNPLDFGGGDLISAGNWDVFLVKLDPGGDHVWSKRFGGANYESGSSVTINAAGNLVIAGEFALTLDMNGSTLTSAGLGDIFVAELDPNGDHLWSARFGDATDQQSPNLALDGMGNLLLAGMFYNQLDFGGGVLATEGDIDADAYVAKLDPTGNHLWSKSYGEVGDDEQLFSSVKSDAAGNVVMVGSGFEEVDFGGGPLPSGGSRDVFLVKLDPNGDHLWSKRFGNASDQFGSGVAVDKTGKIVAIGSFGGTVDFGGSLLTSSGSLDIFLAKLLP